MPRHEIEIEAAPGEVLGMVEEAAEAWGAEWRKVGSGGQLGLPVSAGLRRGFLRGQLETESWSGGSRLVFREEESRYRVHLPALVILLMGGAGGLATLLLPLYPAYFSLFPAAIVLTLAAWFLVVTRLRNVGPQEFLSSVAELQPVELESSGGDGG